MPWDMFPAAADVTTMEPLARHANPVPDPEKIAALAKLVDAASFPMIWVGGAARRCVAIVYLLRRILHYLRSSLGRQPWFVCRPQCG